MNDSVKLSVVKVHSKSFADAIQDLFHESVLPSIADKRDERSKLDTALIYSFLNGFVKYYDNVNVQGNRAGSLLMEVKKAFEYYVKSEYEGTTIEKATDQELEGVLDAFQAPFTNIYNEITESKDFKKYKRQEDVKNKALSYGVTSLELVAGIFVVVGVFALLTTFGVGPLAAALAAGGALLVCSAAIVWEIHSRPNQPVIGDKARDMIENVVKNYFEGKGADGDIKQKLNVAKTNLQNHFNNQGASH
jgi:hypothetical protein